MGGVYKFISSIFSSEISNGLTQDRSPAPGGSPKIMVRMYGYFEFMVIPLRLNHINENSESIIIRIPETSTIMFRTFNKDVLLRK